MKEVIIFIKLTSDGRETRRRSKLSRVISKAWKSLLFILRLRSLTG